jgi:HEAT repeat protein
MSWWTQTFGAHIELQKVMKLQDAGAIFCLMRAAHDAAPALSQALVAGGQEAAAAKSVLREIEPDGRGESFFFDALSSKSSYIRWNAANALGLLYSEVGTRDPGVNMKSVVEQLIDLTFSDPSDRVQHSAGQALVRMQNHAQPHLIFALSNAAASIRKAAIVTFGHIGSVSRNVYTKLEEMSREDPDWVVRSTAKQCMEIVSIS